MRPRTILAAIGITIAIASRPAPAEALPPFDLHGCVEHTSFSSGPDYAGDYRCAGVALDYHLGGFARSKYPLWAGQWLFTDEVGAQRMGWCTFNRGIHPSVDVRSTPVLQSLPNDPTGAKTAYLTWRYGDMIDDLTGAGLWAVFHYYAQDAAGSNRSSNGSAPLVPTLDVIGEASGRQDVEDMAVRLDGEAQQFSSMLDVDVDVALTADGSGTALVTSRGNALVGVEVEITITGAAFDEDASTIELLTDESGIAPFEVAGPPQDVTLTATVSAPGRAQVYRGAPVDSYGHVPQLLVTAGPPQRITATASTTLASPTTTASSEDTTTTATSTTVPETTTSTTATTTTATVAATTTTPATTTTTAAAATTTVTVTTTVASVESPTTPPTTQPTVDAAPPPNLPRTGGTSPGIAYLGTSMLVGGIGVVGAVRRRRLAGP